MLLPRIAGAEKGRQEEQKGLAKLAVGPSLKPFPPQPCGDVALKDAWQSQYLCSRSVSVEPLVLLETQGLQ